jgi:6-pyruvoyltetrahydropterin/6-carboxytetrahydropterin synthase
MYILYKNLEVSASHRLALSYESKCQNQHGHNWKIRVGCRSKTLNADGMIIDFTEIKRIVNQLDHDNLNDVLKFNPTAENIAKWLCDEIPFCFFVEVQETDGNLVQYTAEE